ncbi:hypothetical protein O9X90_23250 [Agrobacterium leguminum]|uniref:hypothetical protein n=1 Tax=Agrobacterium leguminum TaxID=2792015 RepID=UPI0022B820AB|nr:hypothetical protein [Agrobacterium leguminum]MCZ7935251.1 hypothetical protein [Agrobacterium leguminum]
MTILASTKMKTKIILTLLVLAVVSTCMSASLLRQLNGTSTQYQSLLTREADLATLSARAVGFHAELSRLGA